MGRPGRSGDAPEAGERPAPDARLDARGLRCPEPVIMLHNALRGLGARQTLEMLATDPSTWHDVPQFCRHLGHRLLERQHRDGQYRYYIGKGP